MCRKGGYLSLTSSLGEDYLAEGIASFIACKKYDEAITTVNTTKAYDAYREQVPQQQLAKNSKGTKRILVVDDEHDISLTLKLVLEGSAFKVDSFVDPLVALQNFRTGLYDIAILDVKMPVINGFGLYQEIRKLDDKVKICFLTAVSDIYYEAFGKLSFPNIDENCIIHKPIENESLIKQTESILC
jgi:two-component system catabolic regulation response regulator CreB